MRALVWLFRLLLFVLLFGFAVKNDEPVNLQFFFGEARQLPLVFVMLMFFAAGALVGVSATLFSLFSKHREIARLRKRLARLEDESAVRMPPPPDIESPETR